jgi:hypothetical protein
MVSNANSRCSTWGQYKATSSSVRKSALRQTETPPLNHEIYKLSLKKSQTNFSKKLCFWASQSLRARYFQALLEHWPGKCIATSTKHTRRMHTKYIEIWPKAPVNFERHLPNRAKFRGFPTSLTRTLEARPLLNSDHLWLFRTIWHPFVVGIWEKIDPDFEQLLIFQQSQIYINLLTFQTWKRCLAGND